MEGEGISPGLSLSLLSPAQVRNGNDYEIS